MSVGTMEAVGPSFPPNVMEKVAKMQEKTTFIHETFGVPDTEVVIQDYRCTLKRNGSHSGKVWITQNYALFQAKSNLDVKESIPFYRVISVAREGSILSRGVCVETELGKYSFSGFVPRHRDEMFNLVNHLWQYQPTYVHLTEQQLLDFMTQGLGDSKRAKERDAARKKEKKEKLDAKQFKYDDDEFKGRWGEFAEDLRQHTAEDYEEVDTRVGQDALRTALEIRQIGAGTLARLEEQAESLDRTDRSIQETKVNVDQGDRILDGVESAVGQAKNLVTPNMHKRKLKAFEKTDRTIQMAEDEHFLDVPILVKLPNDSLIPALMRFGDRRIICVDETLKEMKDYEYTYDQIGAIVLRARHQHADIKFHDGTERFRCCTSFVQAVVNEVILRTKPNQVTVLFEPNVKQFQYGSLAIRAQGSRDDAWSVQGAGFFKAAKADASRIITNAPEEVADALAIQDEQVNDLQSVVDDLDAISSAIGNEGQRQVDQLGKMHKTADKTLKTAHKDAFRTKRMT